MGHLDSQRSLPVLRADASGPSALAKKLRLASVQSVLVLNAGEGRLGELRHGPAEIATQPEPGRAYDAVVLFVKDLEELRRLGPPAIRSGRPDALLWIAYPKGGATKGATDLPATPWWVRRDVLGEVTAEKGYKAVAFVSVDEGWTALRFKKV